MAVRVANLATSELRVAIDDTFSLRDFTTALSCVNSKSFRFHVYVGNGLGEIIDSSRPKQWHYIRSGDNPTDDLIHGLPANVLAHDHSWFTGPSFLLDEPDMDGQFHL